MSGKKVACAVGIVACWYLRLGQVDQDSDAYETLRSSAMIIFMGVVSLAVIYCLFRGAEFMEAKAVELDDREVFDDPDFPFGSSSPIYAAVQSS